MADKNYELAVFEQGSGEPLVLLHGLISTHRYWNQVIELLDQNKWRIISPDLLGFGDSPKPKQVTYNLADYLNTVDQNITPLVKPPMTLVGHSMGAMTALKWAVEKPELFTRVILTSMPLLRSETQYMQLATIAGEKKLFKTERIAKVGVHSLNWINALPTRVLKAQKTWPNHVAEDWKKHSRHAYRKIMKNAVFADEILELLSQVKVPTHLILGGRDGMIDDRGHKQLQELTKQNKCFTVEVIDATHNLPLENPGVVAEAIGKV